MNLKVANQTKKSMRGIAFGLWLVLCLLLVAGCVEAARNDSPVPPPQATTGTPAVSAWQQKWEALKQSAAKEGKVVIATSAVAAVRDPYQKAFGDKFGVTLEFIAGKPAEFIPKMQAERRAGIYSVDVLVAGLGTVVPLLGPEGALIPLDAMLVLPEVSDRQKWWGGDLLWPDRDHFQVMYFASPRYPLSVNTGLVEAGKIKSYMDLLAPGWKGQISFIDPTISSAGNEFFVFMVDTKGLDYLRQLGTQELVITRDERLQAEWLARGKYPLAIGIKPELMTEFKSMGVPITQIKAAEGAFLTGSGGGMALVSKGPHPNAAQLFLNWLLSREGQTVAAQVYGLQSARVDVPTDFLDPESVRQPGFNYHSDISEQAEVKKRDNMKVARELWGHLLK